MLAKLEHDTKLLSARETKSENDKESVKTPENKVYKYFSNSARHEYNRRHRSHHPIDDELLDLDLPELETRTEQAKCYQCNPTLCPFCNIKLKSYDNWCLKCDTQIMTNGAENRNLMCENCEREYSVCASCENRNSPCLYCRKKRNICHICIRNLCLHCGNDLCRNKIEKNNSKSSSKMLQNSNFERQKPSSERSFQILEVNYPPSEDDLNENLNNFYERDRQPFSMNIEKNSIFHPDKKFANDPKVEVNIKNGEISVNKFFDENNLNEMMANETNDRLWRYFKNYGDISVKRQNNHSSRNRGTQTAQEEARPDAVVNESNLDMPLLREIPKRKSVDFVSKPKYSNNGNGKIANLERRWDVPAVTRHTISTSSPKVLTQLGAIRKQLQADALQLDSSK